MRRRIDFQVIHVSIYGVIFLTWFPFGLWAAYQLILKRIFRILHLCGNKQGGKQFYPKIFENLESTAWQGSFHFLSLVPLCIWVYRSSHIVQGSTSVSISLISSEYYDFSFVDFYIRQPVNWCVWAVLSRTRVRVCANETRSCWLCSTSATVKICSGSVQDQ